MLKKSFPFLFERFCLIRVGCHISFCCMLSVVWFLRVLVFSCVWYIEGKTGHSHVIPSFHSSPFDAFRTSDFMQKNQKTREKITLSCRGRPWKYVKKEDFQQFRAKLLCSFKLYTMNIMNIIHNYEYIIFWINI